MQRLEKATEIDASALVEAGVRGRPVQPPIADVGNVVSSDELEPRHLHWKCRPKLGEKHDLPLDPLHDLGPTRKAEDVAVDLEDEAVPAVFDRPDVAKV